MKLPVPPLFIPWLGMASATRWPMVGVRVALRRERLARYKVSLGLRVANTPPLSNARKVMKTVLRSAASADRKEQS